MGLEMGEERRNLGKRGLRVPRGPGSSSHHRSESAQLTRNQSHLNYITYKRNYFSSSSPTVRRKQPRENSRDELFPKLDLDEVRDGSIANVAKRPILK